MYFGVCSEPCSSCFGQSRGSYVIVETRWNAWMDWITFWRSVKDRRQPNLETFHSPRFSVQQTIWTVVFEKYLGRSDLFSLGNNKTLVILGAMGSLEQCLFIVIFSYSYYPVHPQKCKPVQNKKRKTCLTLHMYVMLTLPHCTAYDWITICVIS